MNIIGWRTAFLSAIWVIVVAGLVGSGVSLYHYQARAWDDREGFRRAIAETTGGFNDLTDATTDANGAITFKEFFDLGDQEVRRLSDASVRAQVLPMPEQERTALRSYLSGISNVVRLQEQDARKGLALSGSNSAVEEAVDQAKSSNSYTADVYLSSARRALKEFTKAAAEKEASRKDLLEHVRSFRAQLPNLRASLGGYSTVADAELAKLDPPTAGAKRK